MPIECNDEKIIIPMEYTDSDNPSVFMYMRYHYTEEYGPTLSFSEDGENFVGYPAKACLEAVEHLVKKGVLASSEPVVKQPLTGRKPVAGKVTSRLPVPDIKGKPSPPRTLVSQTSRVEEPPVEEEREPLDVEGEMFQNFSRVDDEEKLPEIPANPETPEVLKEDAKKMAEERAKALEKAEKGGSK